MFAASAFSLNPAPTAPVCASARAISTKTTITKG